ncbi:pentatricopeptide repeat-containing protein At3g04750, mitochondrial [Magnolia sinica]|uniref:pentatricopeptide repeat-containing protein At3g04750, mitochondrial n=1 Tax=Magnolia sinica TaxID=86752 RepID=UPI00265AEA9D|nr:pentatricopeptide repeat-containing protein At3g04750, mitochondrial [Magnolia sinica]XP_058086949.1 pentatricopeptide repeat-containing protein At3g04750, mitochondrial [Magnolia sinica]XP_058086950.1 pentatricopeptide repeat-containing protein At3g04750, mitochondrial [Magnolia sinica]
MIRCSHRGCSFIPAALCSSRSSWDPTVSLILKHPTLVLLEKYRSRAHFKQILAQMMRIHLVTETFPMSRLLFSSTSHLESLDMAILLFNHYTPQPNLYIYNIMICALSFSPIDSIALFKSMLQSCIYPDKQTLLYLLKAAKCLSVGLQIHAHAIITGFSSHVYLQNSLIKMYAENGRMDLAHQVFQQMIEQDAVSWNIMISGHIKNGGSLQALEFFRKMGVSGLKPDEFTAVSLFTACGQLGDARQGKSVHAWIERRKCIALNLIVGNALLDMYVKLEELELARRVFDRAEVRDCISWNTMIAGYAKVGELEFACKLFNEMPSRDLVSWNSLIAGYAQKGDCRAVMKLFRDMLVENIRPDKVTIVGLVSTAAEMGALHQGRWVHGWLVKNQMKLDAFLGSALIDMYSKCGSIERAFMVFERISERDVMVWTAMIAGLAFHGYGNKALELFREMQEVSTPNAVTLLAILTACNHSGMVDQGHAIFYSMKQISGVEPGIEHYGCLVDLLGRAGRLAEARDVIEKMPMKPSRTIWGAMLSACKAHGNVGLAEIALRELLKLEPEKEGGYVLLSNVYAACGKWSSSDNIRGIMESRGVKKRAGCSSVVVDGVDHEFVAADKRHSRWVEIYCILKSLNREMRSGADISLKFQQQLLDPYLG